MQAADSQGLRQAALALHALRSEDRARVWSRLDPDKRSSLEPLLTELSELGVPAGRPWPLKGHAPRVATRDAQAELPTLVRQARRLEAGAALQALSTQSLDTAAAILSAQPWPWRDAVVNAWPPESRHSLSQRLQDRSASPSGVGAFAMRALLTALLQEAGSLPASPLAAQRRQGWVTRFFQR